MTQGEAQRHESGLHLDDFTLAKVPVRKPSASDRWLKYLGVPSAALILIYLLLMPTPAGLTLCGQKALAVFAMALVLWVTEPVPNYVASLLLMVMLVTMGVWEEKKVLGVLGMDVIWLNVTAFILSSVLVKTNLAKRLALQIAVKFGRRALPALLAFLALQLVLAALVPATAARSVMTLPIIMIVAAVYGSTVKNPNNFGKNLALLNLQGINIFSSGYLTGSTCNIMAAAFIFDMTSHKVYYSEWLLGAFPVVLCAMLLSCYLGPRLLFRLTPAQEQPSVPGGIDALTGELRKMGPVTLAEWHGALIFGLVLLLWVTDKYHKALFGFEISPVMAALIGCVIALSPRIGLLKWNEADIPWHLLIFSAGAYAGGLALTESGAAQWLVDSVFEIFAIKPGINFWALYSIIIAVSMFSHIVFTSKTIRTIILIPMIIAIANRLGFNPVALALPAAFTLSWVVTLPISGKPNVLFYGTNQYSIGDNLLSGLAVCAIGTALFILAGLTLYRAIGIVPY